MNAKFDVFIDFSSLLIMRYINVIVTKIFISTNDSLIMFVVKRSTWNLKTLINYLKKYNKHGLSKFIEYDNF